MKIPGHFSTQIYIYQRMSEGRFPKSRSLGPKCAVWIEAEIDDWVKQVASL